VQRAEIVESRETIGAGMRTAVVSLQRGLTERLIMPETLATRLSAVSGALGEIDRRLVGRLLVPFGHSHPDMSLIATLGLIVSETLATRLTALSALRVIDAGLVRVLVVPLTSHSDPHILAALGLIVPEALATRRTTLSALGEVDRRLLRGFLVPIDHSGPDMLVTLGLLIRLARGTRDRTQIGRLLLFKAVTGIADINLCPHAGGTRRARSGKRG